MPPPKCEVRPNFHVSAHILVLDLRIFTLYLKGVIFHQTSLCLSISIQYYSLFLICTPKLLGSFTCLDTATSSCQVGFFIIIKRHKMIIILFSNHGSLFTHSLPIHAYSPSLHHILYTQIIC